MDLNFLEKQKLLVPNVDVSSPNFHTLLKDSASKRQDTLPMTLIISEIVYPV